MTGSKGYGTTAEDSTPPSLQLLTGHVDDGDLKLHIREEEHGHDHNVFRQIKDELISPTGRSQTGSRWTLYCATLLAAVGGLLFGYDMGVIAGTLFDLAEELNLTDFEQEAVVSILLAGALLGALLGGWLTDHLGRRITIMISCLFFVVGALTLGFAPRVNYIYAGRFLVGVGIALSALADILYIAEISPAHWRGAMVSVNELCITIGLLIAYLVNLAASWRWAFGASLVPAFLQFVGMVYMPYSPRWLVMKGRVVQASQVLTSLRGLQEADEELERIETNLAREREAREREYGSRTGLVATLKLIFSAKVRPRLFIGVAVTLFQQLSGHANVLYYAPIIFRRAGIESNASAVLATAGLGGVKVLFTSLSLCQVDSLGRRILAVGGAGAMLVSSLAIGLGFYFNQLILVAVGLCCFVAAYAFSFGPLGWLLNSEIYPLHVRAPAASLASVVNWASNLAVSMSFLTLMDAMGPSPTFFMYSGILLISVLFLYYLLPETKGKSLEEIEAAFQEHRYLSKLC